MVLFVLVAGALNFDVDVEGIVLQKPVDGIIALVEDLTLHVVVVVVVQEVHFVVLLVLVAGALK